MAKRVRSNREGELIRQASHVELTTPGVEEGARDRRPRDEAALTGVLGKQVFLHHSQARRYLSMCMRCTVSPNGASCSHTRRKVECPRL
jgi:hypothetical protein